jgi:hypothetical protein
LSGATVFLVNVANQRGIDIARAVGPSVDRSLNAGARFALFDAITFGVMRAGLIDRFDLYRRSLPATRCIQKAVLRV